MKYRIEYQSDNYGDDHWLTPHGIGEIVEADSPEEALSVVINAGSYLREDGTTIFEKVRLTPVDIQPHVFVTINRERPLLKAGNKEWRKA